MLTWLEADPAHESELAKVQRQHDLVALSAPVINELYAKDRRRRFGSVLRRWSAAAAAVVLLAFGGYYFHAARDFSRQGAAAVGLRAARTARQPDVAGRYLGMAQRWNDASLSGALYGA